jgi:HK97 gp10 family phage protein
MATSETDELDRYLDSLPDRIRAELSGVVQEQAQMLSDAQRAALQGLEQDPAETGHLEQSCTVVPGRDDLEWVVQAGGDLTTYRYDRDTDYETAVVIDGRSNEGISKVKKGSGEGVTYDHAEAFEHGTSRQPARPFFWPTYRDKREGIRQAIEAAVEKVLK